jgi:hypothetical protein
MVSIFDEVLIGEFFLMEIDVDLSKKIFVIKFIFLKIFLYIKIIKIFHVSF